MGDGVFAGCDNLKNIYITLDNKPNGWSDKWSSGIPNTTNIVWGSRI
jgi:hypothetical protein